MWHRRTWIKHIVPFFKSSLHSARAEAGSSSDQSANYSGENNSIHVFYDLVCFDMELR